METNKLTRRDWFRLRVQPPNQTQTARPHAMGEHVLKQIDLPTNHDGMEMALLPPVREALLSASQIEALFADIAILATNVVLMQRMNGSPRATATSVSANEQLSAAQTAFLEGNVQRVQIRYRWEETAWIDTLERKANEFRLVRIAHCG